jgi:hypothetical protein
VTVNGTFNWYNGTQMGTGSTVVYGILVLGGSTKYLSQRTIVNTYIGYWTSGTQSSSFLKNTSFKKKSIDFYVLLQGRSRAAAVR